ncbi:MAG: hypothetical protein R2744_08410 [Bacteroidales bacterium]
MFIIACALAIIFTALTWNTEKEDYEEVDIIIRTSISLLAQGIDAQTYRQINGWSDEVNDRLESFLNSTLQ